MRPVVNIGKLYFGGSFNPIHFGHLRCATAVAEAGRFSRVVLIPSAHPPHKPADPALAPATDRMAMCQLAVSGNSLFEVQDRELRRSGPSFTIDTARELRAEGQNPINWLIGADMLRLLPQWHQAEALVREVNFVIVARPGWNFDWNTMPQAFRSLESHVVTAPLIDISATDIRARVRVAQPIDQLVPAPVARYIKDHRLYL